MTLRRLATLSVFALALLLATPVLVTVFGAFTDLEWYGQRSEGVAAQSTSALFEYVLEHWGRSLGYSALLSAIVVPLALAIGAPAAWAFARAPFPGSRALEAIALMPLSLPGIALAVGLIQALGHRPRFELMILGHLAYTIPLVLKGVKSGLGRLTPELLDAARTLGATPLQRLWWVTLPLLAPSLLLSSLLVLCVSWGELNVSFLLASPLQQTYPTALYLTFTTNSFPVASAAVALFLLPLVPVVLAIQALGGGELQKSAGA